MSDLEKPIVVEQVYQASVDAVWAAITEVDQMRQWYFEIEAFQPELGFQTEFDVQVEDRNFPHVWKVTEVIPSQKIAYNWNYRGYPGDSFVTFELSEEGAGTKLKLTHEVTESFPQDIPEFKRESGVAGWNYFICERLKEFLEKGTV